MVNFPYVNYSYTQWLLLGFLLLEKEGKLSIKTPSFFKSKKRFFKLTNNKKNDYFFVFDVIRKGKKTRVVYDFSDTPFLFDKNWLTSCDLYFKAQYPKNIESGRFIVDDLFEYVYPDFVKKNINKIKPSLIGVRNLGNNIKFQSINAC